MRTLWANSQIRLLLKGLRRVRDSTSASLRTTVISSPRAAESDLQPGFACRQVNARRSVFMNACGEWNHQHGGGAFVPIPRAR